MKAEPLVARPVEYREVRYLRLMDPWPFFWLNVFALIPLVAGGMIAFGWLVGYHGVGAPLVIGPLPDSLPSWLGWLAALAVLPLHEWLHGLAIRRAGHKPRYGIKWFVLYATADGAYFRRNEFLRVALAPLAIITAGGLGIMLFVPYGIGQWVAFGVMLNAAGSIGDLWMAAVALRFDPSALIQDEADSMRIFARDRR